MNSNIEKACSLIDSMPADKVKEILKAFVKANEDLAEQVLREQTTTLEPTVLDSVKRRILSVLSIDWKDMDDYDHYHYDYRYGSYYEDELERWHDLVTETIDSEVDKLLESHHPEAAWKIVNFVLRQNIDDEYDQASNVYSHCYELYKKIYESSPAFAPILFKDCLNQLKIGEIALSSLFGYGGVGYCFTEEMLRQLGEMLQQAWQNEADKYKGEVHSQQRAPESLLNLMLYYRVRKDWDKYDQLTDKYWPIFEDVQSTALHDVRDADRPKRLIELYERKFQGNSERMDWDCRQLIGALEKVGDTKRAADHLEKLLLSKDYFPDFEDLQTLKFWEDDPVRWQKVKHELLQKPDRHASWLNVWDSKDRARFYVLEEMYDELWRLMDKADYLAARDFFSVLSGNDAKRTVNMMERLLTHVNPPTGDHAFYSHMADDLSLLQKLDEGKAEFQRVLGHWRRNHSRRRLLWEKLASYGILRN